MANCVYCHFDGFDDTYCSKCGNPTPDSREIELGELALGIQENASKRQIRAQVPLNGRGSGSASGKKRYPIFVWLAIGLILGSGGLINALGGDSSTSTGESNSVPANFDAHKIEADGKHIPVFIGKNAQDVRRYADDAILQPSYYDTSGVEMERTLGPKHGNGHGIWMDLLDTYYVCDQLPLPGVPLSSTDNDLRLIVSEDCEAAPVKQVAGDLRKQYSLWGPVIPTSESTSSGATYEGWVVSVARTGWFDGLEVTVKTPYRLQTIGLSRISNAEDPCPTKFENAKLLELGLQEAQSLLPTGTPVTFTYSTIDGAVVTRLNVDDSSQSAYPDSSSINELLVSSGYWEPDGGTANLSKYTVLEKGAKWIPWHREGASALELSLVKLANRAIKAGVGPASYCK